MTKKMYKRIGAMLGSFLVATNVLCTTSVYGQASEIKNQAIGLTELDSESFDSEPNLNVTKVTINVGKTKKVKVKNASETVIWSSDDTEIASVSENGIITGIKAGKTSVTAEISGEELVCSVTVVKKITKKQAIKKVRKELGKSFVYLCDDKIVSYKGKKYYHIYVQARVVDHYSTMTQYLVSTDGTVCREGYCNGNDVGFY